MTVREKHRAAVLAAAMLALAGCGGGGSSPDMNGDGSTPPLNMDAIPGLMDSVERVYARDADDTV